MMDMGYPLHLIDLLAKLYRKQLANVKVAGTLPEWFRVKKGVRQGYVVSPYLYHARPGWTTSIHGQDYPRKSQSE